MKNRKFTYLLITCVAILWAVIFYRIYKAVGEEEVAIIPPTGQKELFFDLVNHETDSVVIDFGYQDPFTKKNMVTADTVSFHKLKAIVPLPTVKAVVNWASIKYLGSVINGSNKSKIAIVQFKDKEMMLNEGQQRDGIKLIRNAGDSIKVGYQNEVRYIKL